MSTQNPPQGGFCYVKLNHPKKGAKRVIPMLRNIGVLNEFLQLFFIGLTMLRIRAQSSLILRCKFKKSYYTRGNPMELRTDIALEAAEAVERIKLSEQDLMKRVRVEGDIQVTRMVVQSDRAAQLLGKPAGTYITVEVPPLSDNERESEPHARVIAEELNSLLPQEGTVLVVGLGNANITPDALGPQAAGLVLATRHIQGEFARSMGLDDLRATAVCKPGVLGQTGVESGELTAGLCRTVKPGAVIVIDALASRSLERLGCTVQLCDNGISPGSGVGNNRTAIDRELLGVPVIGIGVPMVVDARTIAVELTGGDGGEMVTPRGSAMMVTPREIDLMVRRAAQLVAMAINIALQPNYSPQEMMTAAM